MVAIDSPVGVRCCALLLYLTVRPVLSLGKCVGLDLQTIVDGVRYDEICAIAM